MRIAFYAPLKSPRHPIPSGDRRVAELLMRALAAAGHDLELVSEFRSHDATGEARVQQELRARGAEIARELENAWQFGTGNTRPDLWFTYHLYYKAPDWLGPAVSEALGIPYVVAEASYAPKRAGGPWASGHDATRDAIARADLVFAATRHDLECLRRIAAPERLLYLPPFLDVLPYRRARRERAALREQLAVAHALDPRVPWLVVVAMMRSGDKLASYRELAVALQALVNLPWQLVVAGDGPARGEVAALLAQAAAGRVRFTGELRDDALPGVIASADLFVWPAVNEAYGMAMLEAQAAGVPVVSCAARGVPDVVRDGETGLLAPAADPLALAAHVRGLLLDAERRRAMGRRAADWVRDARSLEAGALQLRSALARAVTHAGAD